MSLTGSLRVLSVPGLLQALAAEARTGRLEVLPGDGEPGGSLWLCEGRIVHAVEAPGITGDDAVHRLALAESGTFEFEEGRTPEERTVSSSTDELLMEAAWRKDHAGRPVEDLPTTAVVSLATASDGATSPRFNTLQWRVLAAIDGRRDVTALAACTGVPVARLSQVLAELVRAGVLDVA